jgi:hypothetical protein
VYIFLAHRVQCLAVHASKLITGPRRTGNARHCQAIPAWAAESLSGRAKCVRDDTTLEQEHALEGGSSNLIGLSQIQAAYRLLPADQGCVWGGIGNSA